MMVTNSSGIFLCVKIETSYFHLSENQDIQTLKKKLILLPSTGKSSLTNE